MNTSKYEVGYRTTWMRPNDEPARLDCMSRDAEHAREMLLQSYPDAELVYVQRTSDDPMTHQERLSLALNILEDADVIEVFDDSLFIKVDKELWDDLWSDYEG